MLARAIASCRATTTDTAVELRSRFKGQATSGHSGLCGTALFPTFFPGFVLAKALARVAAESLFDLARGFAFLSVVALASISLLRAAAPVFSSRLGPLTNGLPAS